MVRVDLLLGVVAVVLAACTADAREPDTTVEPAPTTTEVVTTTTAPATTTTATTPVDDGWFVVSVTAELPEEVSVGLASVDGVNSLSVVRVENLPLVETRSQDGAVVDSAPPGFAFPLEVHAIDPLSHADYVPETVALALTELDADEVLLSESSAAFRRLESGSKLALEDGTVLTVAGIVADEWVGAAEAAVSPAGGDALGIDRSRYAIVHFDGTRTELE